MKRRSVSAVGLACALVAGPVRAQKYLEPPHSLGSPTGFAAMDGPTGIAEAGVGWLTLPGADVCIERRTGCSKGDTSLALDLWQLYRQSSRFALGAGILLALIPTTDAPKQDPEGVERDHTRRYFTVEGMLRYYPYVGDTVEWWVGATGGLVVVSDRFVVADAEDDRALLGPRGVTVRTEGGTIGLAGGPVLALAPHWSLGLNLRYAHWFLPNEPARDPLGSEASLTGSNAVFSIGVSIAFRTAL
jgi:hypothetical protein